MKTVMTGSTELPPGVRVPSPVPITPTEASQFILKCRAIKSRCYDVTPPQAKTQVTTLLTAFEMVRTNPEYYSAYYRALAWLGASVDGGADSLYGTRIALQEAAQRFIDEDSSEC